MAMRSIFIALFLTLTVFAQEMDTTFFVNEQGQTIGIIHEKGTVPVIPQQQYPPQILLPSTAQPIIRT